MAFISTVPVKSANDDVRAMYAKSQADLGYVPNYTQLFSHRPAVMAAWGNLLGSIKANMDARRYELVTLAAARAMHSSYCMLAHGKILREQFYDAQQLAAIAENVDDAGLAPADVAIMRFAEHIVRDAASVTQEEVEQLRRHGLTDAEIFDVAAATAARCFFSKLLDALGAEPDSAYTQLEATLKKTLTVGRPISQAAVDRVD